MKSTLVKEKPQRHTSEVSRIFSGPGEIFNVKSPSIKNTKYENLNNFKIKVKHANIVEEIGYESRQTSRTKTTVLQFLLEAP